MAGADGTCFGGLETDGTGVAAGTGVTTGTGVAAGTFAADGDGVVTRDGNGDGVVTGVGRGGRGGWAGRTVPAAKPGADVSAIAAATVTAVTARRPVRVQPCCGAIPFPLRCRIVCVRAFALLTLCHLKSVT